MTNQGTPPLLPLRGLMPPIKRVLPAKSTEQITEALKEVMLELEPASPAMKKYRKYLQRQNTDDDDTATPKLQRWPVLKTLFRTPKQGQCNITM